MQIFYVPHHRAEPDELARWKPPSPYQPGASGAQVFAAVRGAGNAHSIVTTMELIAAFG
jgi:hypothetical protein